MQIAVRRDAPLRLVIALPSRPQPAPRTLPVRFTGPAGSWQAAGRLTAPRELTVALGADELALSRILVVLSGGTLDVGEPGQLVVSLAVGPSDAGGQEWFDCARGRLL
jgi:hypothetical protein